MNSVTLPDAIERLELKATARLWLQSTVLLLRAVGRRIWKVLYSITKARMLLEHGPRRPARRL